MICRCVKTWFDGIRIITEGEVSDCTPNDCMVAIDFNQGDNKDESTKGKKLHWKTTQKMQKESISENK